MTANYHHKIIILASLLLATATAKLSAQDSAAAVTTLSVRYFLPENKLPYIEVNTKKKVGRKFEPVTSVPVNIYFNESAPTNLLGKVVTGKDGLAKISISASFKSAWDSLNEIKFVAESDSIKGEPALSGDVTIRKAILVIDTTNADGVRGITAQLKEKKGAEWVAIKDIEMKLGVKRMLGNLSVGEADTYTADSTGLASAEFKRDSLAGDTRGNLVLVARVEDNDTYGNLVVEKSVPWGKAVIADTHFWHRSLWSTGDRVPIWLLFLAISIIVGVWGVIIYLIRQVIKMKKMGKDFDAALLSKTTEHIVYNR
jgi:hypothetical protein